MLLRDLVVLERLQSAKSIDSWWFLLRWLLCKPIGHVVQILDRVGEVVFLCEWSSTTRSALLSWVLTLLHRRAGFLSLLSGEWPIVSSLHMRAAHGSFLARDHVEAFIYHLVRVL